MTHAVGTQPRRKDPSTIEEATQPRQTHPFELDRGIPFHTQTVIPTFDRRFSLSVYPLLVIVSRAKQASVSYPYQSSKTSATLLHCPSLLPEQLEQGVYLDWLHWKFCSFSPIDESLSGASGGPSTTPVMDPSRRIHSTTIRGSHCARV